MTNVELITFLASVASLILAVLAIALSIIFFRMSSQLSEKTTEAEKGINASVDKLEKLFDRLYADTFSMMRDTVSDMRKHIWPEGMGPDEKIAGEIEKRADEKISILRDELDKTVASMLKRQKLTDVGLSDMRKEMKQLLDKAIVGSRKLEVEAREETVRDAILRQIRHFGGQIELQTLLAIPPVHVTPNEVAIELGKMKTDGLIDYPESFRRDSMIRIVQR